MKNNLKKWFVFGSLFIIIVGSLSHFIYEWSNDNPIVGLFVSVNESTWEHIKLAIFPALVLMVLQYPTLGKNKNFFIATFMSLLAMIILIPLFFYGYQLFFADSLILDILDFIISVIVGQYIFYKVMKMNEIPKICRISSIIGIIIIIIGYLTLTYFPPKIFLFKDPVSNEYGVKGHVSE
jgi:hypothetical protein